MTATNKVQRVNMAERLKLPELKGAVPAGAGFSALPPPTLLLPVSTWHACLTSTTCAWVSCICPHCRHHIHGTTAV